MSRIHVHIDRLALNGFGPLEAKALSEALKSQLSQALLERGHHSQWARSHRTPVMRLGPLPLETGTAGAGRLGRQIARSVGTRLKP
jgi:hypothetical protein